MTTRRAFFQQLCVSAAVLPVLSRAMGAVSVEKAGRRKREKAGQTE